MSENAAPKIKDEELSLAQVLGEEYHYIAEYRKNVERKDEAMGWEPPEKPELDACQKALHEAGAAALCLSGGGIRSATFNLGVMQGLAKLGLLRRFDYVSTVSGGGYLGGWLSSWAFRAGNLKTVEDELSKEEAAWLGCRNDRASTPLEWLRNYSNYLTPKTGLLSVDTWTLVATYVRNLLVVWLAIVPPLMFVLFLPRLLHHFLWPTDYSPETRVVVTFAFSVIALLLLYVGERCSYVYEEDSSGRKTAMTYVLLVNFPYWLGAILLALAWIVSPKTGIEASIVPITVCVMIAGATLIGIVSEWRSPPGAGPWAKLRENRYDIIACVFQGLVMLLAFSALLTATWRWYPEPDDWQYVVYPVVMLGAMGAGDLIYAAFLSRRATDVDRERWARSAAWFAILGTLWLSWTGLALLAPKVLSYSGDWAPAAHALDGILAIVLGVVLARMGLSEKSKASASERKGITEALLLPAAMVIFVVLILSLLSSANAWLEHVVLRGRANGLEDWLETLPLLGEHYDAARKWLLRLVVPATLLLACIGVLRWVNINHFSLHAMYRDRLIRAYLGATRAAKASDDSRFASPREEFSRFECTNEYRRRWEKQAKPRAANPYTGFDDADNLDLFWLGLYRTQPLWVVNMALNVVDNKDQLSWQERKAATFTASPLHCGSWLTCYRPTWCYGGPQGGISAGTAIAISGAAANPNMGYHSSPAMTFLMTFFNVRLGWWLGNPNADCGANRVNDAVYREHSPRNGLLQLLKELFGMTDASSDWIHLSDGGHFENLGLYEMIIRRCKFILVCDAGADPKREFEDLGNAIRKIRIDLKVEIEPVKETLRRIGPRTTTKGIGHAIFRVHYPGGLEGTLLYLKPSLYEDEDGLPRDVVQYAKASKDFPHESTVDQFFSESQFESYRALGRYQLEKVGFRDLPAGTRDLAAAFECAKKNALAS